MALPTSRLRPFRGLVAFAETELRVQLHEEMAILTSMIVQIVLLIFVSILAPGLLGIALVGAVVFSCFALGQRVLSEAAFIRVDHKLNELYLSSPLAPEAYFLGMSLGVLLAYLAPIVVVALVAEAVVHFSLVSALVLVACGAAVWAFSCSIGYYVSTLFRDMRAIWPWASLLYNLFGVLPPVFYPIADAPTAIRWVSLLLPPSAAAALINASITPGTLSPLELTVAAAALAVETLVAFVGAVYWARRSVREA